MGKRECTLLCWYDTFQQKRSEENALHAAVKLLHLKKKWLTGQA